MWPKVRTTDALPETSTILIRCKVLTSARALRVQGSGVGEVSMVTKNRGSKDRPQWYRRYIGVDGKRKHRPTHQPTKALAMRFVAEVEAARSARLGWDSRSDIARATGQSADAARAG